MYEALSMIVRSPRSSELAKGFVNSMILGLGEGISYTVMRSAINSKKKKKSKNESILTKLPKYFISSAGRKVGFEILADCVDKYGLPLNIKSNVSKTGENLTLLEKSKRGFCNGLVYGAGEGLGIEIGAKVSNFAIQSVKRASGNSRR